MHLLITGHTGFKGSWLAVLAKELGHQVSGLSLEPVAGGAFETAELMSLFEHNVICDIRDKSGVEAAVKGIRPDAIIHMAAQPLVIEGYRDPVGTFETNVDGTRNLLEAAAKTDSVKTVLVVTTDKVYRDTGSGNYSEVDALGGFDPYSASKAMADILSQSYGNLGLNFSIGVARAGNVIGRGDVSTDRLLPDILSSFLEKRTLEIRFPDAVRPWQHVLDCVNGYIMTLDYLMSQKSIEAGTLVLNFGPLPNGYKSVAEVLEEAKSILGGFVVEVQEQKVKETSFLTLDSSKARELLGWKDRLGFGEAVNWSLRNATLTLSLSEMQQDVQDFLRI